MRDRLYLTKYENTLAKTKCGTLEEENESLKKQNDELQAELAKLRGELKKTRTQLKSEQSERLKR